VPVTGTATNNCAVSGEIELDLNIGDGVFQIPLKGTQLAARYNGNPATTLTNGLARGFLSEAAADNIMIDLELSTAAGDPINLSLHQPLSYMLAGGTNNCKTAQTGVDDRDRNPPGDPNGERGWWFYLGFQATLATVPEFPTPTATASMPAGDTPTATPTATPPATSTPSSTNTPVFTNTPLPTNTPPAPPTSTPTNTPVQASCPGDCDGDGMVPINEVQRVANIYLETQALSLCTRADRNNDGMVAINEVVLASNAYQFDCPAP